MVGDWLTQKSQLLSINKVFTGVDISWKLVLRKEGGRGNGETDVNIQ